jgi:hypothetical protein
MRNCEFASCTRKSCMCGCSTTMTTANGMSRQVPVRIR